MIGAGGLLPIYLATRPVDFRKGHDGLSAIVQEMFGLSPFSGAVSVFRSKRADRIKVLVWDQTGLVLAHKRLEGAKFVWAEIRDGLMRLSPNTIRTDGSRKLSAGRHGGRELRTCTQHNAQLAFWDTVTYRNGV